MTTAKEMLEEAWKLIKDPKNRCAENFAQDSKGNQVYFTSPKAVCFCSIGALKAVNLKNRNPSAFYQAEAALNQCSYELGYLGVYHANDHDVINNPPKLYARAIEIVSKAL